MGIYPKCFCPLRPSLCYAAKVAITRRQQNAGNVRLGIADYPSLQKIHRFFIPIQLKICLCQPMEADVGVMRIKTHAPIDKLDRLVEGLRKAGLPD